MLQAVSACPGVAGFVDCYEDRDSVQLVTEVCNGGDLKQYVEVRAWSGHRTCGIAYTRGL